MDIVTAILEVVKEIFGLINQSIKGQQGRYQDSVNVDVAQIDYQQKTQLGYQALYIEQEKTNKQIVMVLIGATVLFLLFVIIIRKK